MAISREKKRELIEKYSEILSNSQAIFVTGYRGMSVASVTQLRRQLDETETSYMVVKNSLLKLAMEKTGVTIPDDILDGPVAIAGVPSEIPATAKMFRDFGRGDEFLVIKGGILNGQPLNSSQITELADIPPREVLLARVVGGLQSPIAGLVNVLNGSIRNLVYVLQARVDQMNAEA